MIVEVLDRSGRVVQRVRAEALPITIGRAYSNTVIVDDRYVSPEHLRIVEDEDGTLIAEDIGTLNGMYDGASLQRVARLPVTPQTRLRIGGTTLRVRPDSFSVEPALPYSVNTSWFPTVWHAVGVLFLCIGYLAAKQYLGMVQPQQVLTRIGQWVPYVFAVLAWAGAWALASRALQHRFHFLEHCTIVVLAAVVTSLLDVATDWLAFAFGADDLAQIVAWIGGPLILAGLLFAHTRLCSSDTSRRLLVRATMTAAVITGLLGIGDYASESQLTEVPSLIKPPSFRLVKGDSPPAFIQSTAPLKLEIDALLSEPGED